MLLSGAQFSFQVSKRKSDLCTQTIGRLHVLFQVSLMLLSSCLLSSNLKRHERLARGMLSSVTGLRLPLNGPLGGHGVSSSADSSGLGVWVTRRPRAAAAGGNEAECAAC
jgi:hypothetical protein